MAQSAATIEYTDCMSAEGSTEYPFIAIAPDRVQPRGRIEVFDI